MRKNYLLITIMTSLIFSIMSQNIQDVNYFIDDGFEEISISNLRYTNKIINSINFLISNIESVSSFEQHSERISIKLFMPSNDKKNQWLTYLTTGALSFITPF